MPLALRPFDRNDFANLIAWVSTPEALSQWCAAFFRHPLNEEQLQRYLDSATTPYVREIFAVTDADTIVGHVELSMIWPHLSCRLSRVLVDPGKRRQGFGREAVRLAVSRGFKHHRVDRVDLGVSNGNGDAIGCYEKEGFVHVGTWPAAIATDSGPIDVAWMTLTRASWLLQAQQ